MVPVVTRAPNITNISCWKIAPKPFAYNDPKITLNYYTFISGKTIQDWIERYFINSGIFPKSRCLFYQSVPHCLRFYHYEPQVQKLLDFSIHLSIPALGQFVTIKTSQGEFSCGKTLFHPETTYFTHKKCFFWQGTDPQMGPICSEWYSQSDRRKFWNHRGQYWTLNHMAWKPWISHPSVG